MKKVKIFSVMLSLLLFYPAALAYLVSQSLNTGAIVGRVEESILSYQLSIWITWLIMVVVAVYYKWTTEKNIFFIWTYLFLLISFGIFGYFVQALVNVFELASNFEDKYSLGVFTALQYFVVAALLTAFLQAAVWWFTRRWHRR